MEIEKASSEKGNNFKDPQLNDAQHSKKINKPTALLASNMAEVRQHILKEAKDLKMDDIHQTQTYFDGKILELENVIQKLQSHFDKNQTNLAALENHIKEYKFMKTKLPEKPEADSTTEELGKNGYYEKNRTRTSLSYLNIDTIDEVSENENVDPNEESLHSSLKEITQYPNILTTTRKNIQNCGVKSVRGDDVNEDLRRQFEGKSNAINKNLFAPKPNDVNDHLFPLEKDKLLYEICNPTVMMVSVSNIPTKATGKNKNIIAANIAQSKKNKKEEKKSKEENVKEPSKEKDKRTVEDEQESAKTNPTKSKPEGGRFKAFVSRNRVKNVKTPENSNKNVQPKRNSCDNENKSKPSSKPRARSAPPGAGTTVVKNCDPSCPSKLTKNNKPRANSCIRETKTAKHNDSRIVRKNVSLLPVRIRKTSENQSTSSIRSNINTEKERESVTERRESSSKERNDYKNMKSGSEQETSEERNNPEEFEKVDLLEKSRNSTQSSSKDPENPVEKTNEPINEAKSQSVFQTENTVRNNDLTDQNEQDMSNRTSFVPEDINKPITNGMSRNVSSEVAHQHDERLKIKLTDDPGDYANKSKECENTNFNDKRSVCKHESKNKEDEINNEEKSGNEMIMGNQDNHSSFMSVSDYKNENQKYVDSKKIVSGVSISPEKSVSSEEVQKQLENDPNTTYKAIDKIRSNSRTKVKEESSLYYDTNNKCNGHQSGDGEDEVPVAETSKRNISLEESQEAEISVYEYDQNIEYKGEQSLCNNEKLLLSIENQEDKSKCVEKLLDDIVSNISQEKVNSSLLTESKSENILSSKLVLKHLTRPNSSKKESTQDTNLTSFKSTSEFKDQNTNNFDFLTVNNGNEYMTSTEKELENSSCAGQFMQVINQEIKNINSADKPGDFPNIQKHESDDTSKPSTPPNIPVRRKTNQMFPLLLYKDTIHEGNRQRQLSSPTILTVTFSNVQSKSNINKSNSLYFQETSKHVSSNLDDQGEVPEVDMDKSSNILERKGISLNISAYSTSDTKIKEEVKRAEEEFLFREEERNCHRYHSVDMSVPSKLNVDATTDYSSKDLHTNSTSKDFNSSKVYEDLHSSSGNSTCVDGEHKRAVYASFSSLALHSTTSKSNIFHQETISTEKIPVPWIDEHDWERIIDGTGENEVLISEEVEPPDLLETNARLVDNSTQTRKKRSRKRGCHSEYCFRDKLTVSNDVFDKDIAAYKSKLKDEIAHAIAQMDCEDKQIVGHKNALTVANVSENEIETNSVGIKHKELKLEIKSETSIVGPSNNNPCGNSNPSNTIQKERVTPPRYCEPILPNTAQRTDQVLRDSDAKPSTKSNEVENVAVYLKLTDIIPTVLSIAKKRLGESENINEIISESIRKENYFCQLERDTSIQPYSENDTIIFFFNCSNNSSLLKRSISQNTEDHSRSTTNEANAKTFSKSEYKICLMMNSTEIKTNEVVKGKSSGSAQKEYTTETEEADKDNDEGQKIELDKSTACSTPEMHVSDRLQKLKSAEIFVNICENEKETQNDVFQQVSNTLLTSSDLTFGIEGSSIMNRGETNLTIEIPSREKKEFITKSVQYSVQKKEDIATNESTKINNSSGKENSAKDRGLQNIYKTKTITGVLNIAEKYVQTSGFFLSFAKNVRYVHVSSPAVVMTNTIVSHLDTKSSKKKNKKKGNAKKDPEDSKALERKENINKTEKKVGPLKVATKDVIIGCAMSDERKDRGKEKSIEVESGNNAEKLANNNGSCTEVATLQTNKDRMERSVQTGYVRLSNVPKQDKSVNVKHFETKADDANLLKVLEKKTKIKKTGNVEYIFVYETPTENSPQKPQKEQARGSTHECKKGIKSNNGPKLVANNKEKDETISDPRENSNSKEPKRKPVKISENETSTNRMEPQSEHAKQHEQFDVSSQNKLLLQMLNVSKAKHCDGILTNKHAKATHDKMGDILAKIVANKRSSYSEGNVSMLNNAAANAKHANRYQCESRKTKIAAHIEKLKNTNDICEANQRNEKLKTILIANGKTTRFLSPHNSPYVQKDSSKLPSQSSTAIFVRATKDVIDFRLEAKGSKEPRKSNQLVKFDDALEEKSKQTRVNTTTEKEASQVYSSSSVESIADVSSIAEGESEELDEDFEDLKGTQQSKAYDLRLQLTNSGHRFLLSLYPRKPQGSENCKNNKTKQSKKSSKRPTLKNNKK